MSKQEAARLADALERDYEGTKAQPVIDLLRQWPDGEPVCKLTECQGRPRCQMCRAMDARYTAPPDQSARIAELEAERADFHMQYRVQCDAETKAQALRISELERQRGALLEALKVAVLQNTHEMLMTGEEIRLCESAINAAGGGK